MVPDFCKEREAAPCCWHAAKGQHMVSHHLDVMCCFCGEIKCIKLDEEPGHGLHIRRMIAPAQYQKALEESQ